MKERPILFSGPMVRAILEGRKSMTRRVVKPREVTAAVTRGLIGGTNPALGPCPYDVDRLWVRETWKPVVKGQLPGLMHYGTAYQADGAVLWNGNGGHPCRVTGAVEPGKVSLVHSATVRDRWRPSIHMPRWASRITLPVSSVRVERLQDISEGDARAEGVEMLADGVIIPGSVPPQRLPFTHRMFFQRLWDSLNAKRGFGWKTNPWVWVLSWDKAEVRK